MTRSAFALVLALALGLSACALPTVDGTAPAAGSDVPEIQAAPLEPQDPPGADTAEETGTTDSGVDGGDAPAIDPSPTPDASFGPGLSIIEIEELTAPLAEAEAWLAELEVQWDNGMTYSEIFRAWRSVSAETGPVLAAFELPPGADEAQHDQLGRYYESVQGAHDEWQATVDFIVTYITNYTPEILITKAYQEVEVHLRNAAEVRSALGVAEAERPEIVIESLVDL